MTENAVKFKKGISDGLPICFGYFAVAFAFGIFAVESGMSVVQSLLISMTNVTSAGQLAAVPVIAGGGTLIELAVAQFVINLRYSLMSLSLSQKIDKNVTLKQRLAISFGITDEIFAVSVRQPRDLTAVYMAGLILTPVLGWTLGTTAGAVATSFMPKILSESMGIALYAMFIAIVIPPARENKKILPGILLSVLLSLAFTYLPYLSRLSGGWVIIIITLVVSAVMATFFPIPENKEETE